MCQTVNFFYDPAHASRYLAGSTVKFGDELVLVREVDASGKVYFVDRQGNRKFANYTNKSWDFSLLPTGMINWWDREGLTCYRLTRYPMRQWNMGNGTGRMQLKAMFRRDRGDEPFLNFFSPSFNDFLINRYPSIPDIRRIFTRLPNVRVAAFHRQFAMSNQGRIYHFTYGSEIGKIGDDNVIRLNEKFFFYGEEMTEGGIEWQL